MTTPQEKGRDFEGEIADEFGARRVVSSGSVWFDKLDVAGRNARLSLKFTEKNSFSVSKQFIDEAVRHCEGPGGDGSVPIWVLRLGSEDYDLVIMRKDDWKMMQEGELTVIEPKNKKTEIKKRMSDIPILLRNKEENSDG